MGLHLEIVLGGKAVHMYKGGKIYFWVISTPFMSYAVLLCTGDGSHLLFKDAEYPDGESLQRLLTDQVHCVLSKRFQFSLGWPILGGAFLYISTKKKVFVLCSQRPFTKSMAHSY